MSKRRQVVGLLCAVLITGILSACNGINNEVMPREKENLPDPNAEITTQMQKRVVSSADFDPFADAVVENGIINNGQGFPSPDGVLGIPQLLNPAKTPPITGLGLGFAVYDMGENEAIINRKGTDFVVIEADGSLLASGFGFPEPFKVLGSNNPNGPFQLIGEVSGTGFFDLEGSGLRSAQYLRIEDTGTGLPSGADIGAIIAVNMKRGVLRMIPQRIRSGNRAGVRAFINIPGRDRVVQARIVVASFNGQASPTPAPYYSDLSIEGTVNGGGRVVEFDKQEFLSKVPVHDEVLIGMEVTTTGGDTIYLFDTVSVQ